MHRTHSEPALPFLHVDIIANNPFFLIVLFFSFGQRFCFKEFFIFLYWFVVDIIDDVHLYIFTPELLYATLGISLLLMYIWNLLCEKVPFYI